MKQKVVYFHLAFKKYYIIYIFYIYNIKIYIYVKLC